MTEEQLTQIADECKGILSFIAHKSAKSKLEQNEDEITDTLLSQVAVISAPTMINNPQELQTSNQQEISIDITKSSTKTMDILQKVIIKADNTNSIKQTNEIDGLRITSYNVCYTKLLRLGQIGDQRRQRKGQAGRDEPGIGLGVVTEHAAEGNGRHDGGYGHADHADRIEVVKVGALELDQRRAEAKRLVDRQVRITSYNVCYTKLLRQWPGRPATA